MTTDVPTDVPTVKRFEPPVSEAAAPFWDATRERRFVLPWCTACEEVVWFPRALCPRCAGDSFDWRPASGRGTVYAVTVEHRPQFPGLAAMAPYAVALVQLDATDTGGRPVRLLTNVVGVDPHIVAVDQAVAVTWERLGDGRHLPQFTPADPDASDADSTRADD